MLLLSKSGAQLSIIETFQGQASGLVTFDWDGTIEGQEVPDGSYLLAVKLDWAFCRGQSHGESGRKST